MLQSKRLQRLARTQECKDLVIRPGFDPWVEKIPWIGNGSPLQYSCLEKSMDRGVWGPRGIQSIGCKELDTTEQLTYTHSDLTTNTFLKI